MGTALAVMLIAYGWAGLILIVAVAAIDSIRRENVVQFAIAIGLAGFLPMIVFVWYELTRSMGTTTASLRLRGR